MYAPRDFDQLSPARLKSTCEPFAFSLLRFSRAISRLLQPPAEERKATQHNQQDLPSSSVSSRASLDQKMSSSKRASDAPAADNATPAKRTKTEGEGASNGAGAADSSPAVGRDTDSPSNRGGRGGRGGGRGGRGGGDKKEKSGRGRGGYKGGDRRGKAGDSRTWGGRSDNAKGGMRTWGKKEGDEGSATPDKTERLPKKKVAVLVGYNGAAYKGSQM